MIILNKKLWDDSDIVITFKYLISSKFYNDYSLASIFIKYLHNSHRIKGVYN